MAMESAGIRAAASIVGKALSPLSDGVLQAWVASTELGSNMEDLNEELLQAQAMLHIVRGKEIHNPALAQPLDKLRQLAYRADDALDELDYFRIQDELDGTYDAADEHPGCVGNLTQNVVHTAKACVDKLKCSSAVKRDDPEDQDEGSKQGCFPALRFPGGCNGSRSLPPSPGNQPGVEEVDDTDEQDYDNRQGCLSGLRFCGGRHGSGSSLKSPAKQPGVEEFDDTDEQDDGSSSQSPGNQPGVEEFDDTDEQDDGSSSHSPVNQLQEVRHNVGKLFSCFSFSPYANHDAPTTGVVENPNTTEKIEPLQAPKLKFNRAQMSTSICDIIKQLKPVCAKVSNILSLEVQNSHKSVQESSVNRPKTTPQIIEPKLYGRDTHIQSVVNQIANTECCKLTVLPIFGSGGIGKTTLTQHVYEQVKSDFKVPIWICVSQDFNANRLVKDIVKKIPRVNDEDKNCNDEELIQQRIKGKRVLLVLDDVWKYHKNEWEKVISLFKENGANDNIIIVTTRIPDVANTVKTTEYSLELERLCLEDTKSFFKDCVFGDQKPWADCPTTLEEIGSNIVKKLKGSPLAAKTVGRLLRDKLTHDHWTSVLESKEWESQADANDIMPALKLSYDYLPFHLQQCFCFCALFPEDYEFGSQELVHLWIGLGILYLSDQDTKKFEDVGLCYLNDLVNYGFFKMNEKKDKHRHYVIHDLLHELGVKVSSYEYLSIYSSNVRNVQIPPSVRHLSIIIDDTDVNTRMSFKDYDQDLIALDKRLKVEHLRSLMLFGEYHGSFVKTFGRLFKEAKALRVIFLSRASYNLEDILHKFSKLIHLRYLRIKPLPYYGHLSLPSVLFRLYHLEVIDLQSVDACICSTRHMSNLIKMRHFILPEHMLQFQSNIYRVGKMKFLHELRNFRVGKESNGFELSQLGQLTDIGGSLGIYNLENVQTKEEANKSKLRHKKHLRELILEWNVEQSNMNPEENVKKRKNIKKEKNVKKEESVEKEQENLIENLVPHNSLQRLSIKGHRGTNCPTWLCTNLSLEGLESLCLDNVSWINLPPLGEMWMVNKHGEEHQGCSISLPSFHNLKSLQLSNMSRLKKWVGNVNSPLFPHLEVLIIECCSELIELPFSHPPVREAQRVEIMGWFPKLRELVISECPKLALVPPIPWRSDAPCSAKVEGTGLGFRLEFNRKNDNSELTMEIERKDGTAGVLWKGLLFYNLTDLMELNMKNNCGTSGKKLTLLLSFLPNLSKLKISECENITGLGVAEDAETTVCEKQRRQHTRVRSVEEIITYKSQISGNIQESAEDGLLLLPPHLQELEIEDLPNVSLLSSPSHDDRTEEATAAGEGRGGLQRLRCLRHLLVESCPEFLSSYSNSSSSSFPFPTCLEDLFLLGVKHMETMQAISNLTSLTHLFLDTIGDSSSDGLWPLLADGCITHLAIRNGVFFARYDPSRPQDKEGFSRSSKLFHLKAKSNTGVFRAPICSLLSSTVTTLDLSFDKEMKFFEKDQADALQLLTSLQELRFSHGVMLRSLPAGLHNLINLNKLKIKGCSSIQALPNDLPSSLQELHIESCPAIKSLPNGLPISLETLTISYCGAIKSLPKNGLPSSMIELDVEDGNSVELRSECRKLIGTIPIVRA